jgi:FkbM family methyltransferase
MITTLLILLAIALAVSIAITEGRHKRSRRRMTRLERTTAEQLLMIKPLYSDRVTTLLRSQGRTPRHAVEFRSQFGEDILLYNLFEGKTDGYFIEVGAYDGYTYAVTYAFECMGWTGLLVEPIPERFEACKARRPGSRVVHAALSKRGSAGTATFSHIVSAKKHYEASSFLPDAVSGKRYMRPPKTDTISLTVPLTTMNDLLAAAPPAGGVDFMVLDVEGGELNLLDGFDLDKYRPRAILIEDQAMGRDTTVLDSLTARGYEHVTWLSYNRLLVRKDEPALLARAKQLAQS